MNIRAHAAYHPSPLMTVGRLAGAPIVGGALGVALGWWCQSFAYSRSTMGVLADLGGPWVAAAFVAGALTMIPPLGRDQSLAARLVAASAGGVAGATCLLVATIVYYGPARTGTFHFGDRILSVLLWSVVGIGVGVVFGAAGALWRVVPSTALRTTCLVLLGTTITAEAFFLLDLGVGDMSIRRGVLIAAAVAGAALPLLAGVRWHSVVGVFAVAVLAIPTSLTVASVGRAAIDSLRTRM